MILSSRRIEALQAVRERCIDPSRIRIIPLDLTQNDLGKIAQKAWEAFGSIDMLILNAGIVARDLAVDTDMVIDRRVMETNFFGPIALTKAILPRMMELRTGHIVVISSLSGVYGVPRLSAYAASKHALHGFFRSLQAEVSRHGIKITMVIPGFISTSIISKGTDGKGNTRGTDLTVNESGMSAQECARKIVRALRDSPDQVVIGGWETHTVWMYRLFPRTFRWAMGRNPIRRLRRIFRRDR